MAKKSVHFRLSDESLTALDNIVDALNKIMGVNTFDRTKALELIISNFNGQIKDSAPPFLSKLFGAQN
jgi:hypothetical protein